MRIIGGERRGTNLYAPKGERTRPTSSRARESFFNIVADQITPQTHFLDLFAGSGAMGFEALSRGVAEVVMVERHELELIAKNAAKMGYRGGDQLRVMGADVFEGISVLASRGELFDIVFADPPWHEGMESRVVAAGETVVAPEGIVVVELWTKTAPPPQTPLGRALSSSRRYGDTTFHFYTSS